MLNLVGAFLSVEVALTVTNAVINIQDSKGAPKADLIADGGYALLLIILAGLVGGIVWNLLTWLLGLPSVVVARAVRRPDRFRHRGPRPERGEMDRGRHQAGRRHRQGDPPGVASPIIAGVVAAVGTWLIFRVVASVAEEFTDQGFRWGQIGSASLVSLAHGTNDAQKTMGVITLALIAAGSGPTPPRSPLGEVHLRGRHRSRHLPRWLAGHPHARARAWSRSPRRRAWPREGASAAVILSSSHLGFALSTTQVATGSILGSGVGKPGATVRWAIAGRMVIAWLITLPAAGLVGAVMWYLGHVLGGALGAHRRRPHPHRPHWIHVDALAAPADHRRNVNDEWEAMPETKRLERV